MHEGAEFISSVNLIKPLYRFPLSSKRSMLPLRVRAGAQLQRIIINCASSDPIAEEPLSLLACLSSEDGTSWTSSSSQHVYNEFLGFARAFRSSFFFLEEREREKEGKANAWLSSAL